MEYQGLMWGVLCSIGIFGVKSGVGLHYRLIVDPLRWRRVAAAAGVALVYALLFLAALWLLRTVDMVRHLDTIQVWLRSSMMVHLLVATLLVLWGVGLLRRDPDPDRMSRVWLLLAMPCPVCATVVLFSLGFVLAMRPATPLLDTSLFYGAFLFINLATVGVLRVGRVHQVLAPQRLVGWAMLIVAMYFFLTIAIAPMVGDMASIYRMAAAGRQDHPAPIRQVFAVTAVAAAAFFSGLCSTVWRIRRAK